MIMIPVRIKTTPIAVMNIHTQPNPPITAPGLRPLLPLRNLLPAPAHAPAASLSTVVWEYSSPHEADPVDGRNVIQ